ncbi:MAG: transporter, family, multidrug resistance protein [Frankiaceae bacterium]|nr:transporter, family, multidrug resistance protein [Frankiaceae bacterium]
MAPVTRAALPREVRVLAVVAFFVALGFGIVAPALPLFARSFHVGTAAAAAVVSAFAFLRIAFAFPAGRLIDQLGERLVLGTGIGIVAVSSALAGLAQSYWQLVVLRGAGGVGSAMFSISAMSLLVRMVPAAQRARAVGLWQGGFLLGGIAGPGLGGVVTDASIRLPFFLYAGTLAVAGSVGLVALRATPLADRASATAAARTTLRAALRMPAYRAALATVFADSWASMGVRAALIPLFVKEALHEGVIWTGIGFWCVAGVNGLVLLPAGRFADRVGRRPVLVAGCAISGSAFVLLALVQSLPVFLVAMAVLGLGSGLLDVAPGAIIGDIVEGRGGPVFAAYSMSGDTANVVGPVAAGALAESSYGAAFALTAGILTAATVTGLAMPETRGLADARAAAGASGSAEGGPQVGDQVVGVLDADREPDEVARDLQGGARSAGMGHAAGVLDQRLDAAE